MHHFEVPTVEEFKQRENPDYWRHKGQAEIEKELNVVLNQNVAKNIILFIGDGMGMTTITAARHLKETLTGIPRLIMETLPHIALSQVGYFFYFNSSLCSRLSLFKRV